MFSAALISGLKEESVGLKGGTNNKKNLYSVLKTNKQTKKQKILGVHLGENAL